MQKLSAEFEEAIIKRAASEERQWYVKTPENSTTASSHLTHVLALLMPTSTHTR